MSTNELNTFVFSDRAGDGLLGSRRKFVPLDRLRDQPVVEWFQDLVTARSYAEAVGYVEAVAQVEDILLVAVPWGLVLTALAAKARAVPHK